MLCPPQGAMKIPMLAGTALQSYGIAEVWANSSREPGASSFVRPATTRVVKIPMKQKIPIALVMLKALKGVKFRGIMHIAMMILQILGARDGARALKESANKMKSAAFAARSSDANRTSMKCLPDEPYAREAMSPYVKAEESTLRHLTKSFAVYIVTRTGNVSRVIPTIHPHCCSPRPRERVPTPTSMLVQLKIVIGRVDPPMSLRVPYSDFAMMFASCVEAGEVFSGPRVMVP
jgi:hypothetical protein